MVKLQAVEPKLQVGHCFSHNLHSHTQIQSANLIGIAHYQTEEKWSRRRLRQPSCPHHGIWVIVHYRMAQSAQQHSHYYCQTNGSTTNIWTVLATLYVLICWLTECIIHAITIMFVGKEHGDTGEGQYRKYVGREAPQWCSQHVGASV